MLINIMEMRLQKTFLIMVSGLLVGLINATTKNEIEL